MNLLFARKELMNYQLILGCLLKCYGFSRRLSIVNVAAIITTVTFSITTVGPALLQNKPIVQSMFNRQVMPICLEHIS